MKKYLLVTVLLALMVVSCQKNEKSYPGSYSYNSTITVNSIIGGSTTYSGGIGQMRILSHKNSDTLSIMMQTLFGTYREFQAVSNGQQLDIVPYTTKLNIPIEVQINITGGSIIMRTNDVIQIREEFTTILGDTGSVVTIAERN